ncbi:hypothetical protein Mp_3g13270 [Marchantia polymorpha subsp. ruderalis]|uniref:Uncharacterized protein n=2 Tax=Marchantia polymorpha TaxID=3197 RepID=A0AAF6B0C8_MARPO|nr:hypothetical protein MARPO_0050s0119 [Marchantia polymorpha]BBN05462.1 hypothetical protein Mp_3g13270 [Marchantia polymorpha subsp. ruderalis]|eukprot:PTQ38675.1 hypothetical protein MARPO_0050s0119 [Marchantia polymorpha]
MQLNAAFPSSRLATVPEQSLICILYTLEVVLQSSYTLARDQNLVVRVVYSKHIVSQEWNQFHSPCCTCLEVPILSSGLHSGVL